ncbi:MAG TPA: FimV/HubP family polar landmark protein [Gammaproteobacteria bacterium]|nr:FimV/HubP family polar landmark protein [Gammaproteobacteria bacterium]
MKINCIKWIILIIALPVTLYAAPNSDPADPANVEDVFLNAFQKIKTGAANVQPEANEISSPAPSPTHVKKVVSPAKSVVSAPPSSVAAQHTITSISQPTSIKKTTEISPAITKSPVIPQGTTAEDQHIQSELADLRRQNAALQKRVGQMNQQMTQLQQALVESQKLLSKDINTLQSATISPHKALVQPAAHTVGVVPMPQKASAQPVQPVKAAIELPPPQFSQAPSTPIPPAPSSLPVVENTQPPQVVTPKPIPGIDEAANTVNNQAPRTEIQEESMPRSFLDSTVFLLAIGLVLMAAGILLLIWLFWPRSQRASSLSDAAKAETPSPLPSPGIESEPEYEPAPEFFQQPEQPIIPEPEPEIEADYSPMKISELESFEQLIEEEQEYLTPGQEAEGEDMEYGFMNTKDAIPVKLDLARAYLEMGDYVAVQETLKTVLAEGSKAQQREAELLLEQARLAQGD